MEMYPISKCVFLLGFQKIAISCSQDWASFHHWILTFDFLVRNGFLLIAYLRTLRLPQRRQSSVRRNDWHERLASLL